MLRENAAREPDAAAFTFIDYELDPRGYPESLTRSEVQRRVQALAGELASCGSPGDRIAICAPQGLDYIIGFLGAMAAGYIAVPLPVPQLGVHDERVYAAVKDSAPAAILTTSDSVDAVVPCRGGVPGRAPAVIELDALGLDEVTGSGSGATVSEPTMPQTETALLQYTSGSTRAPAAVMVTHRNVIANLDQVIEDYFEDNGKVPPPGITMVSWLPFYHDMGLLLGVVAPVLRGFPAVLTTPTAFLQKPSRWMRMLADHHSFSAAPNFAFELAARRTKDDDMAGLDLGNVHTILSGAERIHAATIRRFTERFSSANLPDTALKPSYGLAEAMVYVASSTPGRSPVTARFDYEKLSSGYAQRLGNGGGSELVGHGRARACTARIVDPETCAENPAGKVGEIWVHGRNVTGGYWRNPQLTEKTFGGRIADPSPGTPEGPWLRTGDLGVISDDELFIVGRIKDLLIVDGRNHYPDDIEATIQEITAGRAAAISVPDGQREQLVTIIEFKPRRAAAPGSVDIRSVKQLVRMAVSESHSLRVADVVVVPPGSIPITTSGKIRRSACAQQYLQDKFAGMEIPG
ncbi:AMP-binding protein [Mycobacterium helveticum]|uniref:AMP-binding protein n=2 Tax=Mycobacterium helveticum TaxID=2592811 RepID=A0A557XCT2_9MYCO|nr:AMP-binding protein [Mycobacterium helveticum]TVS89594.1 AMP-binding protein [Mycobacterium helveticum]